MASNAKDADAATLSEAKFTVTPSAVELSAEEEERRCLAGWWHFDWLLYAVSLMPLDEFTRLDLVSDPGKVRENIKDFVVVMSDQVPCWLKIAPGKGEEYLVHVGIGVKKELLMHNLSKAKSTLEK